MLNPDTARLLINIIREGKKNPRVIMLGHLSSQRNKPKIAIREKTTAFKKAGIEMSYELKTAPLKECSEVVPLSF